jgi:hypothetical protein
MKILKANYFALLKDILNGTDPDNLYLFETEVKEVGKGVAESPCGTRLVDEITDKIVKRSENGTPETILQDMHEEEKKIVFSNIKTPYSIALTKSPKFYDYVELSRLTGPIMCDYPILLELMAILKSCDEDRIIGLSDMEEIKRAIFSMPNTRIRK